MNRFSFTIYAITILVIFPCNGTSEQLQVTAPESLSVMTWNIWGELNQDPRYTVNGETARRRTIEIIKESKADIIAMIETYGSAADIAKSLDFYHSTPHPKANLCIFSRYKLTDFGTPKGLSSFSFIGATAHISETQKVRVHCIWLTSGGRHIVEIKNKELSDRDFVLGDTNRANMMKAFLGHPEVKADIAMHEDIPIIVAGDFNCVTHLDYNKATKSLTYGREFDVAPTHDLILNRGFLDTYRNVNPNITKDTLGYTWTTVGPEFIYKSGLGFVPLEDDAHPHLEYRNPYARIDFIYSLGNLKPVTSNVIKYYGSNTKRSFPEFPSDHAAVITTFKLNLIE